MLFDELEDQPSPWGGGSFVEASKPLHDVCSLIRMGQSLFAQEGARLLP